MMIQPVENPNIPAELTKQITTVRNQITLGEGEVKRLNELVTASKYEINQLLKQKVDLDAQIENAQKTRSELEDLITTLTKKVASLNEERGSLEEENAEMSQQINEREELIQEEEAKLIDERTEFDEQYQALIAERDQLNREKKEHADRVEKLTKALS